MLEQDRGAVAALPLGARLHLIRYFRLAEPPEGGDSVFAALHNRDLSRVDLVLALLRGPRALLPSAEALAGVRIQVLPPQTVRPLPPLPCRPADEGPDARRITRVERNPRLPTTPAFQRFKHFRVGRTLGEAVRRGATRRDVREALSHGWVEVSP